MSESVSSPSFPLLGASWQPEVWPEDQWPLDVARMKEAGVTCVRLFEYAWHRLEPREWEFDFEWSMRVLDMLKEAGIAVIAATPTAGPPTWMVAKYPEILPVSADGKRSAHGGRRRYSVVSSRYREFCARIIDQMVHAFRGHEAIIGWQIDDRIGGADYGNEARRAFHSWLHERFGQIESLNKTWGMEAGSLAYEYFEQVPLPAVDNIGHGPMAGPRTYHPSLMVAFQRFINDQWSSFVQIQCEVIRAGFDKPLTTNMTADWGMNYFRQNHLLDRVGMSLRERRLLGALMHLDRMRGEKPGVPFWIFDAPQEEKSAWTLAWLSVLMGAESALYQRWRQPWSGTEMSRTGFATATGKWSAQRNWFEAFARQLKEQGEFLRNHPPVEARVGLVMSNESAWAFSVDPPEGDFNYEAVWRDEFYLPVAQSHYWRDVIDQTADFCPYHVLIMPLVPMLFRPTKDRLKEWVSDGGCLLIGPLTGYRTEEFTAWTDQEFGGLEELMGASCSGGFKIAPGDESVRIVWGGPEQQAAAQGEELPVSQPRGLCHAFIATSAHVLARYEGGDAAILMNKIGNGTVITLGARVDRDTYLDLINTLCELAKVEPLASGSGEVAVIPRMNPDNSIAACGLVNLSDQRQTVTLRQGGTDRSTGQSIPAEVTLEPFQSLLIDVSTGTGDVARATSP